ncbi:reverse transcriptase [Phytophthora megakarya]|uniref:Reverse transcriptase n=1 Tax=Phytophthora megakarya TaxID=4795 RepID=A0A225VJM3_9STRA|nr:reverse transcriptase [Phytophthora megakarya]
METKIPLVPTVERPKYETPRAILQRPKTMLIQCRKVETSQDQGTPDCLPSDESPSGKPPSEMRPLNLTSVASEESNLLSIADEDPVSHATMVREALEELDQVAPDTWATNSLVRETTDWKECEKRMAEMELKAPTRINYIQEAKIKEHRRRNAVGTSDLDLTWDSDQDYDECVYYNEGSHLYAEDVDGQMAVLPEVPVTTEDVKIEDIQLSGSDNQTPEEIDRLRQRIWKFRHLLIGKGNPLPPAARGVVCDIDVGGGARPIALKCRKLRIQFREKLADLIKVENLLKACDEWNLSIGVDKSFWGMPKVEYLGQKVSHNGLEANPKDLSALTDLAFPGSLGPMQSFLRSLNYYSRFIKDYAIYASVLYELRETDFAAMMKSKHGSNKATVVVYASDWAISGSLMQEYDQIYHPVTFASRTLKSNELNYGIAEKEVLALLRILDLNYNTLITKCVKGEDEILGALAASITPRSEVDKALISIAPKKEPRRKIQAPISIIRRDEELYVVSFDGSARVKRGGGAYSAILWKLPEWRVLKARSGYAEDLTVNEAEYHGLLLCLDLLEDLDPRRLVICGDSNLVIRQVRGEIDYWNGSADSLASAALQRQCGIEIESDTEIQDLITLNRLDEILIVKVDEGVAQISAVTTRSKARSGVCVGSDPGFLQEEVVRELRIERIRQAQDEESWITGLKKYLVGEIRDLTQEEAKMFGSIAMNYEVEQSDLLFYCPTTKETAADRDKLMRLVIPETLQQDILHHYHTSLQGGHQGVGRTYDRIRDHFHWRGKGRPRIQGESPGNLQATYPFQIIAMDHIPSLPRSFSGNTELLIFVDLLSRYVIAKASVSRSAQTIAETYEECVFRRFGVSEVIGHDREPGFMSDFFKSFNKILGQRQHATMAYRPQANGSAERNYQGS